MATDPIVHNASEEAVQSRKELNALIGHKVSAKHRELLVAALTQTNGRSFNELLASMPNVGEDSDFARSKG